MAVEQLPDPDALSSELVHLRHRLHELLRQHDKLTERMLAFPNDFGLAWARSLAAEIESLSARITALEAELLFRRPYEARRTMPVGSEERSRHPLLGSEGEPDAGRGGGGGRTLPRSAAPPRKRGYDAPL